MIFTKKNAVFILFYLSTTFLFGQNDRPNIVIIYADDMGFTDVGAYGDLYNTPTPGSTPHMDALADEGMLCTQAHSGSAVCTPSRYSLLTGKFSWRTIASGVGGRFGRPEMPDSDITIAEYLKTQGYQTAAFGKWHLGGTFYDRNGNPYTARNTTITNANNVDWERPVKGHATDNGFDIFKGLAVAINFPPYVYLDGDRVQYMESNMNQRQFRDALNIDAYSYLTNAQLDDGLTIGTDRRAGLGDPSYKQAEAGPILVKDVESYLADQAGNTEPFFVFASLYSPHKPWHVTSAFANSEGFQYGDFMHEVDDRIGRIIDAIDNNGFKNNTIVIITSDNGPENTAFTTSRTNGKDPNGPLRGIKRDSWEGGTRTPFIIRWPGVVSAGTVSDQLLWHGDIFPTIAEHIGDCLPDNVAPDGENILPVLQNPNITLDRKPIVTASIRDQLSIKTSDGWKLIDGTGGAGHNPSYDADNNAISNAFGNIGGNPKQLFFLPNDLGERNNLINDNPEKAQELLDLLVAVEQQENNVSDIISTRTPTDAVTVAAANSTDMGLAGDFVLRERASKDNNTQRHISGFVKFDLNALGSFNPSNGDRAYLEVNLHERLNTSQPSSLFVARVTGGDWNNNNLPNYNWATKSGAPIGPGSQADELTLIQEITTVNTNSSYNVEVSSILQKWVNGTAPNYGLGLYLSDAFNGVSLDDIKLTMYKSDNPCETICTNPNNVAVGKATQQSSTYANNNTKFGSANAVDGSNAGHHNDFSMSHTVNEQNAWWEIDLGAIHDLSSVKLWNRTNCCADRLTDFHVLVSDVPFTSTALNTTINQNGVSDYHFPGTAGRETDINLNRTGRYVRVQLSGTNALQLAEVEIMGCTIALKETSNELIALPIKIAPNPATDYLNIDLSNYMNESISCKITSISGAEIQEGKWGAEHNNTVQLDLTNMPNGVYVIYIQTENYHGVAVKFVVAK